MIPTEHEGTVALEAACEKWWNLHYEDVKWKDVGAIEQNGLREAFLPLVWAALEALPDRRIEAWDEGYLASHKEFCKGDHTKSTPPLGDNPYRG